MSNYETFPIEETETKQRVPVNILPVNYFDNLNNLYGKMTRTKNHHLLKPNGNQGNSKVNASIIDLCNKTLDERFNANFARALEIILEPEFTEDLSTENINMKLGYCKNRYSLLNEEERPKKMSYL